MKKIIALILISSPLTGIAATDSCKDQLVDISDKNEMTKIHSNNAEIARLNIACGKIETYCTDERQATRASDDVNKREINVKKAEFELQEAQQDLAETKADGHAEKIMKKTHKAEA